MGSDCFTLAVVISFPHRDTLTFDFGGSIFLVFSVLQCCTSTFIFQLLLTVVAAADLCTLKWDKLNCSEEYIDTMQHDDRKTCPQTTKTTKITDYYSVTASFWDSSSDSFVYAHDLTAMYPSQSWIAVNWNIAMFHPK